MMMMIRTMSRMPPEAEIGARGLALWTGQVRLAGWAAVVGREHADLHLRPDSRSPGHCGVLLVSGDHIGILPHEEPSSSTQTQGLGTLGEER